MNTTDTYVSPEVRKLVGDETADIMERTARQTAFRCPTCGVGIGRLCIQPEIAKGNRTPITHIARPQS